MTHGVVSTTDHSIREPGEPLSIDVESVDVSPDTAVVHIQNPRGLRVATVIVSTAHREDDDAVRLDNEVHVTVMRSEDDPIVTFRVM